jgi:hypothetical protein
MKKKYILLFIMVFSVVLYSCNGSKRAGGSLHHRGVNNSHYEGY